MNIAAYYFPNYHQDRRNLSFHGEDWDEWKLVREAKPRFPGHQQPRIPLWGYEDEANPKVMEKKIAAAADHGIDAFIFDWYYYDDGPFLERCLDEGFMNADNNERIKFALMWANHDWLDIHPADGEGEPALLYPGKVRPETFEHICDSVIERYFQHPSYWKINGCPYFSIYELFRFIEGFGGDLRETAEAISHFRSKVRDAGFPDLHLNAVIWGVQLLPGEKSVKKPEEMISLLGFDSVTSYVWVHHAQLPNFPISSYRSAMLDNLALWNDAERRFPV
ncbi:MAG: glycoside hydrolase family 99-like domain-containing protein, partial [Victivallales bacterium]|nr:glycoside hydrolase family 99-like domain-containing protein [Victivallales bacterium]